MKEILVFAGILVSAIELMLVVFLCFWKTFQSNSHEKLFINKENNICICMFSM